MPGVVIGDRVTDRSLAFLLIELFEETAASSELGVMTMAQLRGRTSLRSCELWPALRELEQLDVIERNGFSNEWRLKP